MNKLAGVGIPLIVLILVGGSLALAIIDRSSSAAFLDLAKIGVGGYLGYSMNSGTKNNG